MLLFRKWDFLIFKVLNSNMPQFFLRKFFICCPNELKKRYLTNTWFVCQVTGISKRLDNFYFWRPMLLIELISNSNMEVSLIETCFCYTVIQNKIKYLGQKDFKPCVKKFIYFIYHPLPKDPQSFGILNRVLQAYVVNMSKIATFLGRF